MHDWCMCGGEIHDLSNECQNIIMLIQSVGYEVRIAMQH